jgi:Holliday junction DNA helicase RuvB
LRDRFGFTAQLDYYDTADLVDVVLRSAIRLGIVIDENAAEQIASRSRGTPRIANRLLRRARDYAQVHHDGSVSLAHARAALELYEVDELGLDRLDRAVLRALIDKFGGGPVGLSTLALAVSEEPETVDSVCEPYLVRTGLIVRTPRGRVATPAGWAAIGRVPVGQLPLE